MQLIASKENKAQATQEFFRIDFASRCLYRIDRELCKILKINITVKLWTFTKTLIWDVSKGSGRNHRLCVIKLHDGIVFKKVYKMVA